MQFDLIYMYLRLNLFNVICGIGFWSNRKMKTYGVCVWGGGYMKRKNHRIKKDK